MRTAFAPAALALACALAGPSVAQAQTGGVEYVPPPWLAEPAFSLSPASVAPGATLTLSYRVDGRARRMRVRVDLLPEGGGRAVARLRLGSQPTGRRLRATWRPALAAGRYTARLRATARIRATVAGRRRTARSTGRSAVEVLDPPPVAAPGGVFPVQGPYDLGAAGARFGAGRSGHIHQGQDISAAEGTAVVSPRAGFVSWRAYQAGGAGHYLVVRADDTRDHVFMHLQDGSILVQKGQAVAAGQRIAAVGTTGRSEGPHLHFEIWPDGWFAGGGSQPVDPLPDLLAWAS